MVVGRSQVEIGYIRKTHSNEDEVQWPVEQTVNDPISEVLHMLKIDEPNSHWRRVWYSFQ